MLWSFIAVLFSGWLYVDASYRGPGWQLWLFKPITIALLLALAWQTPLMSVTGYFIVLGLLATLAADILLLLPIQRMLFAIATYSACHLLYTIGFLAAKASLTFFWPLPLLLLVIIAVLLAILWSRLDTLRWPVVAFVSMNAVMVWVAGEQYFALGSSNNLSWFAGSVLLFIAHGVWLIHHYRFPFRAHQAMVAASYFAGHFLISAEYQKRCAATGSSDKVVDENHYHQTGEHDAFSSPHSPRSWCQRLLPAPCAAQ